MTELTDQPVPKDAEVSVEPGVVQHYRTLIHEHDHARWREAIRHLTAFQIEAHPSDGDKGVFQCRSAGSVASAPTKNLPNSERDAAQSKIAIDALGAFRRSVTGFRRYVRAAPDCPCLRDCAIIPEAVRLVFQYKTRGRSHEMLAAPFIY